MTKNLPSLLPDFHPQLDFFVCNLSDISQKGDLASMEHPIFSLTPLKSKRRYEHNGYWIEVIPSHFGSATVHDRDVIIYCISQCLANMERGQKISRTMRFIASELMIATNRNTKGGSAYTGLANALDRLSGTRIKTNISNGQLNITKGFGLLEEYEIVTKSTTGRMMEIEVKLPDWICDAIQNKNILTIHHNYFRLRKTLEKRLYELGRKHCGNQKMWKISLSLLLKKTGSQSSLKEFKRGISEIINKDATENYMPDYSFLFDNPKKPDPTILCIPKPEKLTNRKPKPIRHSKDIPLSPDAVARGKKFIPKGTDIYATVDDWQYFVQKHKIALENPAAHFIDFAKKWGRNKQLTLSL